MCLYVYLTQDTVTVLFLPKGRHKNRPHVHLDHKNRNHVSRVSVVPRT